MESKIRSGDWDLVMRFSREFFELLKFGKNSQIETDLKALFKLRNGSDIGFDNFFKAILELFEYISKFIHEKNKQGSLHVKPTPASEDAYLIYSLCANILNLIVQKI